MKLMNSSQMKRRNREWESSPQKSLGSDHKKKAIDTPLAVHLEASFDRGSIIHGHHLLDSTSSERRIDDFFIRQQKNEEVDCIKSCLMLGNNGIFTPLDNYRQHIVSYPQDAELSQAGDALTEIKRNSSIHHRHQQQLYKNTCSSPVPNKGLSFISPYCSKFKTREGTVESKDSNTASCQSKQRCYICNQPCKSLNSQDLVHNNLDGLYQVSSSSNTYIKNSLFRYFPSTKHPPPTQPPLRAYNPTTNNPQQSIFEPCSFCDRIVCRPSCIHSCERCYGRFCTFCSTVNYNGRLERIYCLDCNTFVSSVEATTMSKCVLDSPMDLS